MQSENLALSDSFERWASPGAANAPEKRLLLFSLKLKGHWRIFAIFPPCPGLGDVVAVDEAKNQMVLMSG